MLLVTTADGNTHRFLLPEIRESTLSALPDRITSLAIKFNGTAYTVPAPRFTKRLRWGAEVDKGEDGEPRAVRVWYQAGPARLTITGYIRTKHFRADLALTGEMRYHHASDQ